jgi:hypothetical protein
MDSGVEKDALYNASDGEQVKSRREKLKTRELQKKAALRRFISEPEGRMWMWDLLGRCGIFRSSFSSEPLVMAFNEGRRDIGTFLASEIGSADSDAFFKMAIENREER